MSVCATPRVDRASEGLDGALNRRKNDTFLTKQICLESVVFFSGKMCCLIVRDMRSIVELPERPLESICYRRVERLDDYKVSNRHAQLDDVMERVAEICA